MLAANQNGPFISSFWGAEGAPILSSVLGFSIDDDDKRCSILEEWREYHRVRSDGIDRV